MNGWVEDLIDRETAQQGGKVRVWGLGSKKTKDPARWEGEQRDMRKSTQQEALWFQRGNLHQNRHNSPYLSLQLKARMEWQDTPVHGLQESHHEKQVHGIRVVWQSAAFSDQRQSPESVKATESQADKRF